MTLKYIRNLWILKHDHNSCCFLNIRHLKKLGLNTIKMAIKIDDCWEQYATEEFYLRKSMLTNHVNYLTTQNGAYSEKVNHNNIID